MMLCASVFSGALFFGFGFALNGMKKSKPPALHRAALPYVLISGIAGCIYIRLNISLAAIIPSAIFFPVSNGALVLISTALGFLIFREKLSKLQLAGILLGCVAIAVIGCGNLLLAYLFSK
jgi:drug/metabolite transporter (DMT)-like permease